MLHDHYTYIVVTLSRVNERELIVSDMVIDVRFAPPCYRCHFWTASGVKRLSLHQISRQWISSQLYRTCARSLARSQWTRDFNYATPVASAAVHRAASTSSVMGALYAWLSRGIVTAIISAGRFARRPTRRASVCHSVWRTSKGRPTYLVVGAPLGPRISRLQSAARPKPLIDVRVGRYDTKRLVSW